MPSLIRTIASLLCFVLFLGCFFTAAYSGEIPLDYYLPEGTTYDEAVPTPQEFLGFQIGERHIHHHQLVAYMRKLAEVSPRVTIEEFSHSHGGRPQVMLFITSPENHKNLETIRQQHLQFIDPRYGDAVDITQQPAVINMGYSVHGNEASGGNAAPLVAYYLAAAQCEDHEQLLKNTVILLDPCLNPDGFERFANWANENRGQTPSDDPLHREHREPWPNGRTNYYWFDLNRDWLPAVHPESQGRLEMYHRWKPNVQLDFHEMGSNSTFFFQPGEPLRNNPLVPQRTIDLTGEFAKRHAALLDKAGSLYYTQEGFDDFYMGKGSTYPDLHGAVGILFEQASSRGLKQQTIHGELTFPFTIRNQVMASMSSLQATRELRQELLTFQHDFYEDSLAIARNAEIQGHLFAAPHDPARLHAFLEILGRHKIEAYKLAQDVQYEGQTFRKGEAVVVPCRQEEYRFLTCLFENRTEFKENIFYDVSAWGLPSAFNLQHGEVRDHLPEEWLGQTATGQDFPQAQAPSKKKDTLAYLLDGRGYYAPRALHRLLDADVTVHVAKEPFATETNQGRKSFRHGTLMIPLGVQPENRDAIHELLQKIAKVDGLPSFAITGGLTPEGIDLGSANFAPITKPKVILVTGGGASTYQAGEVWHLLDQRIRVPVSLIDVDDLGRADLSQYTSIVLVSGRYDMNASTLEEVRRFVNRGGTLIAFGGAVDYVASQGLAAVTYQADSDGDEHAHNNARRPYTSAGNDAALDLIAGAIFTTDVDLTHPLGYGMTSSRLPVFRSGSVMPSASASPYNTPVAYTQDPLIAGYVSSENLNKLRGSAAVLAEPSGRGRVIMFADDPNFRGFWYGTNRLFTNAIFFGEQIGGGRGRGGEHGHQHD